LANLSRPCAPRRPQWQGSSKRNSGSRDFRLVACVAASVVALTYLGPYLVLVFYALWLSWPCFRPKLLQPTRALLFPALIVADVLASVLWSINPDVTARAALQFASMIGCTIIAARLVSVHSFIKGFALGACAVLVLVIGMTGGLPDDSALVGGLGSKNQVGEIAELGFYCALMLWFTSKALASKIFLSVAPMVLCLVCLYHSHSATAEITLAAVLVMSFTAYFIGRFPARFRLPPSALWSCAC
jgi:exopolysaccharide production protein ExoQ